MQIESPKEKTKLIKLSQIAEEINSKFGEAIRFAGESTRSGKAAIIAAIECGKLLNKAKDSVDYGEWQKWLLDNCGDISQDTASRWMGLAKSAHVRNLEECGSLRKAYIACGLLPEASGKSKAIGTAEVNIFDSFVSQIVRACDRICDRFEGVDGKDIPEDRKGEIRDAIAKVKEVEGKL
jgi:hypothetical protein